MIRKALLMVLVCCLAVPAVAGTADDNKKSCGKFYSEVVNKGNLALIDELCAENFVNHEKFPGMPEGRAGVRQFVTMMRAAFPDFKMDVEMMITEGDMIACYVTMGGTHKGEFMGMPGTGKKFSIKTIDILRMKDGKAVEHWGVTDTAGMMEQLGVMGGHGKKDPHEGHNH